MARLTVCSFYILTASLVHGANNQNSEWLTEAVNGWNRISESCSNISATCSVDMEGAGLRQLKYARRGENRRLEIVQFEENERAVGGVFAMNEKYGFKLSRQDAGNEKYDWRIAEASEQYSKRKIPLFAIMGMTHGFFECAWKIDRLPPLPELVELPGFQVEDAGMSGTEDGKFILKCRYEASEEDLGAIRNLSNGLTGKFPVPSFHGTIHLIPSKSWAIAGYDLIMDLPEVGEQSASSLELKGHIAYQMMVDLGGNDTPVPETMSLTAGTKENSNELTIALKEWEFIELPTNEFTLSAFGLPEAAVIDVRSNKVVVFLLLTALLFLVIGVLLRRKQTASGKVTKNLGTVRK